VAQGIGPEFEHQHWKKNNLKPKLH
jgi:hypothetical protein